MSGAIQNRFRAGAGAVDEKRPNSYTKKKKKLGLWKVPLHLGRVKLQFGMGLGQLWGEKNL